MNDGLRGFRRASVLRRVQESKRRLGLGGAAIVAENLRKRIAESHGASAPTPWTTASIGVARISGGHDTVDDAMATADRAMHSAKGLGGDSVATDPGLHQATQDFALVGADVWRPDPLEPDRLEGWTFVGEVLWPRWTDGGPSRLRDANSADPSRI